jgi:small subunit ribosomal protein S8
MLTRIRNGVSARHESVVMPSSKAKVAIASVLKDEGFIRDYELETQIGKVQPSLKVHLSYGGRKQPVLNGIQRISKPGLRVYARKTEIPRVLGGLGLAILSTSHGIMTGTDARKQNLGGEVLAYVW